MTQPSWAPEPLWRDAATMESWLADEEERLGGRLVEVDRLSPSVVVIKVRIWFGLGPVRKYLVRVIDGRVIQERATW